MRELDEAVAKALGWTDIRDDHYTGSPGVWFGRPPRPQPGDSPQNKAKGISMLPYFSTDIAAAWTAIEALRAHGWLMSLSVNDFTTEPWDCRLFHGPNTRVIAHGATAPEAISRAVCAAVAEGRR
jgi:hypothetical protein